MGLEGTVITHHALQRVSASLHVFTLWFLQKSALIAVNKVSSKVMAVSFSEDGNHFVTAGNRHVRFWYLDPSHANQVHYITAVMKAWL